MAKNQKSTLKKDKVEVATRVLSAEITVTRTVEGQEDGKLSAVLEKETGKVTIDLSMYRTIKPHNLKTLGQALILIAKEAEGAMEML